MASQFLHDLADDFENAWPHVKDMSVLFDSKFGKALAELRTHAEAYGEQLLADAKTAGTTLLGQAEADAAPLVADLKADAADLAQTAEAGFQDIAGGEPQPTYED
jgi:hypothetical protein